jgi:hypothetical protein
MTQYEQIADACLQTLSEYAPDRYGRIHSPIWCGSLHVDRLEAPKADIRMEQGWPLYEELRLAWLGAKLDGTGMYSAKVPEGPGRRAIRVSQRGFGCANLYYDQPMLRACRRFGTESARAAMDEYVGYYLDNLVDLHTGLIEWGWHNHYDVHEDAVVFADGHHHEIQVIQPDWPSLHAVRSEQIQQEIEQIAAWHVDIDRAVFGRHPDRGDGCSFAMAGGEFTLAFAFLATEIQDATFRELARQIPRFHWEQRHPGSCLIPNRIAGEQQMEDRFDFHTADTSTVALWAGRVLLSGVLLHDEEMVDLARRVMRSWYIHGWDQDAQRPYGLLNLDGTPVETERPTSGYERHMPKLHLDLWAEYVMGYEYPFRTALSYVVGYHYTNDPLLLEAARAWAECYRAELPANNGNGTFAQGYGQLISLFVYLAEITSDKGYLTTAENIAQDAIDKLWNGKILRGYPGKGWYESVDGPGYLVQGLFELGRALDGEKLLDDIDGIDSFDVFGWNL